MLDKIIYYIVKEHMLWYNQDNNKLTSYLCLKDDSFLQPQYMYQLSSTV